MNELIGNLKKLRLIQGKNQAEVSAVMGYELSSSLSHLEIGNKGVSSEALIRWFIALDIDLNNIVLDAIHGVDFNLIHKSTEAGIEINKLLSEELESK